MHAPPKKSLSRHHSEKVFKMVSICIPDRDETGRKNHPDEGLCGSVLHIWWRQTGRVRQFGRLVLPRCPKRNPRSGWMPKSTGFVWSSEIEYRCKETPRAIFIEWLSSISFKETHPGVFDRKNLYPRIVSDGNFRMSLGWAESVQGLKLRLQACMKMMRLDYSFYSRQKHNSKAS